VAANAVRARHLARAAVAEVRTLGHLAVRYPFGLAGSRSLTVGQSNRTPVVLVHGFGANKSCFGPLTRALQAAGHDSVVAFNYNPLRHDLPELAAQLATEVARVRRVTGAAKVHLVGHSLGGLLIRYYVTQLGGHAQVDTAITIGSPHGGSWAGHLGALLGKAGRTARRCIPGSGLLDELDHLSHKASGVTWVAYHAPADAIVSNGSARLSSGALGATNVEVNGVGHLALLTAPHVVRDVAHRLSDKVVAAAA